MKVLLDTNVVLRYADPAHPARPVVTGAIGRLRSGGHELYLVPQNFYEFWVVATRPVANHGFGLTTRAVVPLFADLDAQFPVLFDPPTLLADWRALVAAHDCKGKVAHDARIAAALLAHGLTHLLTFNGRDFARFPHVAVLDPAALAGPPGP